MGVGSMAASSEESSMSNSAGNAVGTLAPAGPPSGKPLKVAAGRGCAIDLQQSYTVAGTLSGTFEVDYQILTAGSCDSPPGTHDEDWIARGTFSGTVDGSVASAHLSYTAHVAAGVDVAGRILLGGGLEGELRVRGNFSDGKLSYEGSVE